MGRRKQERRDKWWYGVEKYLYEEYDILHSFGERQIVAYIDEFLSVRKEPA